VSDLHKVILTFLALAAAAGAIVFAAALAIVRIAHH
jgi:hypothetical protein